MDSLSRGSPSKRGRSNKASDSQKSSTPDIPFRLHLIPGTISSNTEWADYKVLLADAPVIWLGYKKARENNGGRISARIKSDPTGLTKKEVEAMAEARNACMSEDKEKGDMRWTIDFGTKAASVRGAQIRQCGPDDFRITVYSDDFV